jgi:hypothetical protein
LLRLHPHEHSIVAADNLVEQMPRAFLNSDFFDLPRISACTAYTVKKRSRRAFAAQTILNLTAPLETEDAFIVNDSNGKPLITDGPFAETKEQLIC